MDILEEDFNQYYKGCVCFAKSYVCNNDIARSIAAEAMAVYWEKRSQGEVIVMPLPFLFSVVRNKALHYLRDEASKNGRRGQLSEAALSELNFRVEALEACDPHALFEGDVRKILHETLNSLGSKTERVFQLSRFQGMSNKEIARQLGLTEKSVEYHISRALKTLRTALKDYLPLVGILLGL